MCFAKQSTQVGHRPTTESTRRKGSCVSLKRRKSLYRAYFSLSSEGIMMSWAVNNLLLGDLSGMLLSSMRFIPLHVTKTTRHLPNIATEILFYRRETRGTCIVRSKVR